MRNQAHRAECNAAALYVAIELSAQEWWLTMSATLGGRRWRRRVAPGDVDAVRRELGRGRSVCGVPATAPRPGLQRGLVARFLLRAAHRGSGVRRLPARTEAGDEHARTTQEIALPGDATAPSPRALRGEGSLRRRILSRSFYVVDISLAHRSRTSVT
jgi:hypothetical protein